MYNCNLISIGMFLIDFINIFTLRHQHQKLKSTQIFHFDCSAVSTTRAAKSHQLTISIRQSLQS